MRTCNKTKFCVTCLLSQELRGHISWCRLQNKFARALSKIYDIPDLNLLDTDVDKWGKYVR